MDNKHDINKVIIDSLEDLFDEQIYDECSLFKIDKFYYISEGAVLVMERDRIFKVIHSGDFVGVGIALSNKHYHVKKNFFIKPLEACKIHSIETEKLLKRVEEKNLHKDFVIFFIYRLSEMTNHLSDFNSVDAYKQIREGIYYYELNKKTLLGKITLSRFLIELTDVSKSRVMHILKELRYGGYYEFSNQDIIIKKKLPSKF
ncbi:hypothetical protein ACOSHH_005336 [Klebsiella aerogenes]